MFAFPLAQALLANASGQETMVHDRINTLVGYILQNHFFEIGFDGQKTKCVHRELAVLQLHR